MLAAVAPPEAESVAVYRGRTTWRPRSWKSAALMSVLVFGLAMGTVTAAELVAGKPVTAIVRDEPGSGTSFGGGTVDRSGGSGGGTPATAPSGGGSAPAAEPSGGAGGHPGRTPGPTPSGTPGGSPSSTPSSTPSQSQGPDPSGTPGGGESGQPAEQPSGAAAAGSDPAAP